MFSVWSVSRTNKWPVRKRCFIHSMKSRQSHCTARVYCFLKRRMFILIDVSAYLAIIRCFKVYLLFPFCICLLMVEMISSVSLCVSYCFIMCIILGPIRGCNMRAGRKGHTQDPVGRGKLYPRASRDGKFVPNAWEYNWATLSLGEINRGTWSSMLGESQI
jgi:hypothetical protein